MGWDGMFLTAALPDLPSGERVRMVLSELVDTSLTTAEAPQFHLHIRQIFHSISSAYFRLLGALQYFRNVPNVTDH